MPVASCVDPQVVTSMKYVPVAGTTNCSMCESRIFPSRMSSFSANTRRFASSRYRYGSSTRGNAVVLVRSMEMTSPAVALKL